jgi:hypothetical protein
LAELGHQRVASLRAVRGTRMALLPLPAYRGVAIRMEPPAGEVTGTVAVVLEHSDPALSRTLYRATHGSDVIAEWQAWGRVLALPLLVTEADGGLREAFVRIGALRIGCPARRRRRRSSLEARRPASLRRQGAMPARSVVHRGERRPSARR